MTEAEVGAMKSIALKVEGVHEPRGAGDLQQLEKARKRTLLGSPRRTVPWSPAAHLEPRETHFRFLSSRAVR